MTLKVWRSPYSSIQLSNSQAPEPVFFTGAWTAVTLTALTLAPPCGAFEEIPPPTLNQSVGCDLPSPRRGVFLCAMKRLILATALAAAAFGSAPSQAADLGSDARPHARHVRTTWQGWNWRDRCAWEGHYCLYAEYGYVYHYPWDDRPIAYEYASRRRHRR